MMLNNRIQADWRRVSGWLLAGLLMGCSMSAHAVQTIGLYLGQVKVLELGEIVRVAVGNTKLVGTSITEAGQLILIAEDKGETSMHLWFENGDEKDFKVVVVAGDTSKKYEEIESLLNIIPGAKVRRVGDFVVVEGEVRESDQLLIDKVAGRYEDVLNLTQLQVFSREAKMIVMNVDITEFSTNKLRDIGVDWSGSFPFGGPSFGYINQSTTGGGESPGGLFNVITQDGTLPDVNTPAGFVGIGFSLSSLINALVNSGDAVVLARPRLSSRSGGKASFLAGGEIPIPIASGLGTTSVEFKPFGIKLDIAPHVDNQGNISADIDTEISAVDNSVQVQGTPGFTTRKTSTQVAMRVGQTLVISGLVSHELSDASNQVAGLGELPIIGRLFSSSSFRNRKTELVIFVTPQVYDAESEINKSSLERATTFLPQFNEATDRQIILD